jgi:chitinase
MKYFCFFICLCFLPLYSTEPVVGAYVQSHSQYWPKVSGRPPFSLAFVEVSLLTDIYFAFATFSDDFTLRLLDPNDEKVIFPGLQRLKIEGVRHVLFSVGGWNFNSKEATKELFSKMTRSQVSRKTFISSALAFAKRYKFDGIDVDWEYPADLLRGGREEDLNNFLLLLQELSEAFWPEKLLVSFCIPGLIPYGMPKRYHDTPANFYSWVSKCQKFVDRITVMAYDYHGPFDDPKLTGVNSPLDSIEKTLEQLLTNGLLPSKLLLGLPSYGHSYSGVSGLSEGVIGPGKPFSKPGEEGSVTALPGTLAYFEIADKIATKQLVFAANNGNAYAYNIAKEEWVSFDTPETIRLKVAKAKEKGLLGVVFWSLEMDEYYWQPRFPLLRSASLK